MTANKLFCLTSYLPIPNILSCIWNSLTDPELTCVESPISIQLCAVKKSDYLGGISPWKIPVFLVFISFFLIADKIFP